MNITLSCTIFGVFETQEEYWEFESEEGFKEVYNGENHQHEIETCIRTGDLIIPEVTANQSGNYTCVYSSNLKSIVRVKVVGGLF